MKIMICFSPFQNAKGCPMLGQNRQFQWFHNPSYIYPMVPASAATLLDKNNFKVIWADAIAGKQSWTQFIKLVEREKPDIMVIETKTPVVKQHWNIVQYLGQIDEDTKFILVGDHVTARPKESMERCERLDYVITGGDFDVGLLQLARCLRDGDKMPKGIWFRKNGVIENSGHFELVTKLDDLPFIDRDLTKWWLYGEKQYKRAPFTYTMAGRDCPWHRCTFCSWTTLYPQYRVRSPENLLNEIGILIDKYSVREIFDDTGTFPSGKWLESFCKGMIERGYNEDIIFACNFRFDYLKPNRAKLMKKAGFRLMKLGLESANQKTLDRLNKGTNVYHIIDGCKIAREAGLEVHLTIMVGYPWETRNDAIRTLELAKYLMRQGYAEMLQSTVVIPYPGTPLHEQAIKNNWLRIDTYDYERYDMTEPILKTPDMSPEQVMQICDNIYKIFLTPKYVLRKISTIRSQEDLRYILRGFKAVIGHIRDFAAIRT
ncbi:MAG: B12-binding domain-containing radical SAM protein [Candidatus Hodarchaeota archaeon]